MNVYELMTIKCDFIKTYSKKQCIKIAQAIDDQILFNALDRIPNYAFGQVLETSYVDWYGATVNYENIFDDTFYIPKEFIKAMYIR